MGDRRKNSNRERAVLLGLMAMGASLTMFWILRKLFPSGTRPETPLWIMPGISVGALILFVSGWLTTVARLLPWRMVAWQRLLLVVILYVAVGAGWIMAVNAGLYGTDGIGAVRSPDVWLLSLLWPLGTL